MFIFKAVSFLCTVASGALLVGALSLISSPEADSTPIGTDICYAEVDLSDPESMTERELASFQQCMNLVQFGVHRDL